MRITDSENISVAIDDSAANYQIVYGEWYFDSESDFDGLNMPYFTCTLTNMNNDVSVSYRCPFSVKRVHIEETMMRVIRCYNELVKHKNIGVKHGIFGTLQHNTLEWYYKNELNDALFDYIKEKYSERGCYDYDFNFRKNFNDRAYTYISNVHCINIPNGSEAIELVAIELVD